MVTMAPWEAGWQTLLLNTVFFAVILVVCQHILEK
jgi:hypothetical protein